MLKKLLLFGVALAIFSANAIAQTGLNEKDVAKIKETHDKETMGWKTIGTFGLDLSQLALINPRIGAGENRIGAGGSIGLSAVNKQAKFYWISNGLLQLAVQRIGASTNPFQKNVDLLRLETQVGIPSKIANLYYAAAGSFESQLLKTYVGNLTKSDKATDLLSQFLAPARVKLGLGLDYHVTPKFSVFFAPVALQYIYVGNDAIAKTRVFGNDLDKRTSTQVGAQIIARYNDKYLSDKITFGSVLNLYTAYNNNPGRFDVLWTNNIGVAITKHLSLGIFAEVFYDDDVKVITKRETPPVKDVLGLKASITESIQLKYGRTF